MTIKVYVESTPAVVDLEFPKGIPAGGGITLIVNDPKDKKLDGEEKLSIQFTYVNEDIIPIVRNVTIEDNRQECDNYVTKVHTDAVDEDGIPLCIVKPVYRSVFEGEDVATEEDERNPRLGKVLDCLPESPIPLPPDFPDDSDFSGIDENEEFDEQFPELNSGDESYGTPVTSPEESLYGEGNENYESQQMEDGTEVNIAVDQQEGEAGDGGQVQHTCMVCDFTSNSESDYKFHVRDHAVRCELCCKYCQMTFRTLTEFKEHCLTHTGPQKTHTCPTCKKTFKRKLTLQRHMVVHSKKHSYTCPICSKAFFSMQTLKMHRRSHFEKDANGEHLCNQCGKMFASFRGLQLHIRKHIENDTTTGEERFTCPVCRKSFMRPEKRDHHVVRKHTKDYPHHCTLCKRGFMFQKNLDKHFQELHSGHFLLNTVAVSAENEDTQDVQSVTELKCNYCNYVTLDTDSIQKHLATHPEIKFYSCDKCKKEFSSEARYKRHIDNNLCDLKPECDICGKSLSSMTALKNHKLCHGELKAFKCPSCEESFKTKTTLKYHMQARHGEIKSYKCEHCSKTFSFLSQKKRHVSRVHLRETNHPCNLCPMKFMTKRELLLHLLCGHKFKPQISEKGRALMPDGTHAPNLKIFKCEFCDHKTYSRKGFLRHQVDHTGVWPYACDLCGKGFIERNQAERHIRATHTSESYPCPHCPRVFVLPSSYQEHLQSHSEDLGFACPQCNKYFETHGLYNLHLQTHSMDIYYNCSICGQGFAKIAALNFHMIIHKHEKGGPNTWTYNCEICKKKFKYAGTLAAHKYKHSQDIIKKCELCGITLRTEGLFEVHMRRHRGEKPFKCPYCDKAFTLSMTRKHHITRFHTGDYKIFCPLCQKGVVSNKMLRRHLYHVHGAVITKKMPKVVPNLTETLESLGAVGAVEAVQTVETTDAVVSVDMQQM